MRVFLAAVNLELLDQFPAQPVFRKHTLYGMLDYLFRSIAQNPLVRRNFLTAGIPRELQLGEGEKIIQGYLSPDRSRVEVRIRKKGNLCFLTVKRGMGMVREEEELEIESQAFERFWPFAESARVEKSRYTVLIHNENVEIDVYNDPLGPLIVSEIEFDPSTSTIFDNLPPWIGVEITGLACFTNRNLAYHGLPGEFAEYLDDARKSRPQPITHTGAVPFRFSSGDLEVLCVPSPDAHGWTVPFDNWDSAIDLSQGAERVVRATAGAVGAVDVEPLGIYKIEVPSGEPRVQLFALRVDDLENVSPMCRGAERRWFSITEAIGAIHSVAIGRAISALHQRVR